MFPAQLCPTEFLGIGESRAASLKATNYPEVPSAMPAGKTPQKRTVLFLSPEGDPEESACRRWPLCSQVSVMHISHKHWFPLSCPRHTDQPEPPQLTQDRGPYGGPLQAGGMRGGPEVHRVGAGWGARKQLTGVWRPDQRGQASRRGGGCVLGTSLESAGLNNRRVWVNRAVRPPAVLAAPSLGEGQPCSCYQDSKAFCLCIHLRGRTPDDCGGGHSPQKGRTPFLWV